MIRKYPPPPEDTHPEPLPAVLAVLQRQVQQNPGGLLQNNEITNINP